MRYFLGLLSALLIIGGVQAQIQLPFNNQRLADSSGRTGYIRELAGKALLHIDSTNPEVYFDQSFRLNSAAGNAIASNQWLDSMRAMVAEAEGQLPKYMGIQFEAFNLARLQTQNAIPDSISLLHTIEKLYQALPESDRAKADAFLLGDLKSTIEKYERQLSKCLNHKGDSIPLGDAILLCRTYASFEMQSAIVPLSRKFLAQQEAEKYIAIDSMLIRTSTGGSVPVFVYRLRKNTQPMPVVLMNNIYVGEVDRTSAKDIAMHDYVGVIMNLRGKRNSHQPIEPYEHDAADIYDVIDWISKQSWCNGSVGMFGGSYLGFSQWAAIKKVHPALKTIVPQVAVGAGIDFPMIGNMSYAYALRWARFVTNTPYTDLNEFQDTATWNQLQRKWYLGGYPFRDLDSLMGKRNTVFQRWLSHPAYDSYWQKMVPYKEEFKNINIPILTITGYFDDDQIGALYYLREHYKYHPNPNHFLIIGPYDHFGAQSSALSEVQGYVIDSVARLNFDQLVFNWFDYVLKGKAKPELLKNRINFQVMGTNSWEHVTGPEQMTHRYQPFYLTAGKTGNQYLLNQNPDKSTSWIQQQVDLSKRNILPDSIMGEGNLAVLKQLPWHEGFEWISAPFQEPVILSGAVKGMLELQINKRDADLELSVFELRTDGSYHLISSYAQRASFAKDRTKRQLLQPGITYQFPVQPALVTARKIQPGSRLVVHLGIVNYPGAEINYGSGKPVREESIKDAGSPMIIKWSNRTHIDLPVW